MLIADIVLPQHCGGDISERRNQMASKKATKNTKKLRKAKKLQATKPLAADNYMWHP